MLLANAEGLKLKFGSHRTFKKPLLFKKVKFDQISAGIKFFYCQMAVQWRDRLCGTSSLQTSNLTNMQGLIANKNIFFMTCSSSDATDCSLCVQNLKVVHKVVYGPGPQGWSMLCKRPPNMHSFHSCEQFIYSSSLN